MFRQVRSEPVRTPCSRWIPVGPGREGKRPTGHTNRGLEDRRTLTHVRTDPPRTGVNSSLSECRQMPPLWVELNNFLIMSINKETMCSNLIKFYRKGPVMSILNTVQIA